MLEEPWVLGSVCALSSPTAAPLVTQSSQGSGTWWSPRTASPWAWNPPCGSCGLRGGLHLSSLQDPLLITPPATLTPPPSPRAHVCRRALRSPPPGSLSCRMSLSTLHRVGQGLLPMSDPTYLPLCFSVNAGFCLRLFRVLLFSLFSKHV